MYVTSRLPFAFSAQSESFGSISPAPDISARARTIQKRALVFDGHVHELDREFCDGGSMGARFTEGQWDLQRACDGDVGACFLSIFVPEEYYPGRFETKQAFRGVHHALQQFELNRA